jgi:hypothetical protein
MRREVERIASLEGDEACITIPEDSLERPLPASP